MTPTHTPTLQHRIIGAAIEVHKALGPGLLESTYEACLIHELRLRHIHVERQKTLPVSYKSMDVERGYRIDLLVENRVIVEIKAVHYISPLHQAQLQSYLKLSGHKEGLLINFNVPFALQGIQRIELLPFCGRLYYKISPLKYTRKQSN